MLDAFLLLGPILELPTINSYAEKMMDKVTGQLLSEIQHSRASFINEALESEIHFAWTIPKVSAKCLWGKALKERVNRSIQKMRYIARIPNSFGYIQQVREEYESLSTALDKYIQVNYNNWFSEIQNGQPFHLDYPVLTVLSDQKLTVNVNHSFFQTLQEARSFSRLDYKIPLRIHSYLELSDQFQLQVSKLFLICDMYNTLHESENDAEWLLMTDNLKLLEEMIQDVRTNITWTSFKLNEIIDDLYIVLRENLNLSRKLLACAKDIRRVFAGWTESNLLWKKKEEVYNLEVFDQKYSSRISEHRARLDSDLSYLYDVVDEIKRLSLLNSTSSIWQRYFRGMKQTISLNLKKFVLASLQELLSYFDDRDGHNHAFVEVHMEVKGKRVVYSPEVDSKDQFSIFNCFRRWEESILSYMKLVYDDVELQEDGSTLLNAKIEEQRGAIARHLEQLKTNLHTFAETLKDFDSIIISDKEAFVDQMLNRSKRERQVCPFLIERFEDMIESLHRQKSKMAESSNFWEWSWIRVNCQPVKVFVDLRVQEILQHSTSAAYELFSKSLKDMEKFVNSMLNDIKSTLESEGDRQLALTKVTQVLEPASRC
eukprot:745686-Hanusia_phi.AAC.2